MEIQFKPSTTIYKELEIYLAHRYSGHVPYTDDYIQKEYIGSVDEARVLFKRVLALHETIESFGILDNNEYELFFKPFGPNRQTNLGSFFFEKESDTYTEETFIASINEQLGTEFEDRDAILDYVMMNEDLDAESKYRMLLLLQNYDGVAKRFRTYMEHYRPLIKELDALLPDYNKTYQETVDINSLIAFIKNFISDIDKAESIIITPYMLTIDNIRVQMSKLSFEEVTVSASLEMLALNALSSNTESLEKQFQEGVKALAEPMKYAALKLCLKEEKYGSQLAEELGISGATVSHHMQVLVNLGYMFTQIKNKRVYYRTNLDAIEKDLGLLKNLFEQ